MRRGDKVSASFEGYVIDVASWAGREAQEARISVEINGKRYQALVPVELVEVLP